MHNFFSHRVEITFQFSHEYIMAYIHGLELGVLGVWVTQVYGIQLPVYQVSDIKE